MNKLLLYEFKYTRPVWVLLLVPLPVYTGFSIFDCQILSGREFGIDYWGGLYTFLMSIVYIYFWILSSRENREMLYRLLPVSEGQAARFRFYFHLAPMFVILFYLVSIHFILLNKWHAETASIIGQTGLLFGIFAAIYVGRELWLLYESEKQLIRVLVSIMPTLYAVFMIISILIILPFLYKIGNREFSLTIFNYSKILFYLNAVIILSALPFIYTKRKSFLY